MGQTIAERAKGAKIDTVVFDRGGFGFHGKVKALADAARDGGLKLPLSPMPIYAGNFDPIEETVLPEGDLLPLAIDEEGETGEEAAEAEPSVAPAIIVRPKAIPLPSITPEADPEPSPEVKRRRSPRRRR